MIHYLKFQSRLFASPNELMTKTGKSGAAIILKRDWAFLSGWGTASLLSESYDFKGRFNKDDCITLS